MPRRAPPYPLVDPEAPAPPDEDVGDLPVGYREVENSESSIGAIAGGYFSAGPTDEQSRLRLHDAQVILSALGYLAASAVATGWSLPTKDALGQFQRENSLWVTGQLDANTYEALLGIYETVVEQRRDDETPDSASPIRVSAPLRED